MAVQCSGMRQELRKKPKYNRTPQHSRSPLTNPCRTAEEMHMSTHTHAVQDNPSSVPRSFFPYVESIRGQSLPLGHPESLPLVPGCDLVRVNHPLHHDTFEVFNGVVWTVEMAGDGVYYIIYIRRRPLVGNLGTTSKYLFGCSFHFVCIYKYIFIYIY